MSNGTDEKDEQEEREEKAASGPAGILSAVLGMGSAIGGMIPSLIKNRQNKALERYQRGGGAGATAARMAGSEAARRVIGASTAQPSSGRAGNLRAGLRAAENITSDAAARAGMIGAQEGLAATQMLNRNEWMRKRAFQTLGAGVGQGLAGIAGMLAASRDQGPAQPGEEADAVPGEGQMQRDFEMPQPVNPITGLPQPTTATGMAADTIARGRAGLDKISAQREAGGYPDPAQGPAQEGQEFAGRFAAPGAISQEMGAARTKGALQGPDTTNVAAMQQANLANLAQTTAEKQDAAAGYANAVSDKGSLVRPSSDKPPAYDPANPLELEAWIYSEASKYNPAFGGGLSPREAATLLIQYGYEPNYAVLGVQL